ncbi:UPF0348 protein YlbM [Halolactibacillus alkaliphilus]|uniref:tRNA(Met) cytidine acetate ligase n=1 Tax=Halolactibacillus alkaliphilus TaxID=442899 RepID=A0A511WZ75_9BACI|nr:nucleotidyltransferase [Halolactibacillus alkaliphilus]GEN55682.1 UPF0348 protein YlbM [Halolactibacillus alkaliphilus]GGN65414.1 UPF0348 protein YlbM [Halolactibacillus alkaliphilus]SFO63791.1 Predicted nucleotidyltransferase [Halolactibacillus alkaliphilus]
MNILGLIVEYNPFHNGHLYHIEQARNKSNADVVITIMSGHFLQRGEPAIVDKFTRSRMAVMNGSDLVIELPTIYAIQHRDLFCYSAVSILNQLGVNTIIFGSETGEIEPFNTFIANETDYKKEIDEKVKHYLKQGESYPRAYSKTLADLKLSSIDDHLPNNSLGIGYVRAVKKINSNITIDTIKRKQAAYHQKVLSTPIASATSIRKSIADNHFSDHILKTMPSTVSALMQQYKETHGSFANFNDYYPFIQYKLLTTPSEALKAIHGMTEGIEHRLIDAAKKATSIDFFLNMVTTKRYTTTRIKRLLIHLLLNITTETIDQAILTIDDLEAVRCLAQTPCGEEYLKIVKQTKKLSVLSKIKKDMPEYLNVDLRASAVYYLFDVNRQKNELKPPFRYR